MLDWARTVDAGIDANTFAGMYARDEDTHAGRMRLKRAVAHHACKLSHPVKPKPYLMRKLAECISEEIGDEPVSYYFVPELKCYTILDIMVIYFSKL